MYLSDRKVHSVSIDTIHNNNKISSYCQNSSADVIPCLALVLSDTLYKVPSVVFIMPPCWVLLSDSMVGCEKCLDELSVVRKGLILQDNVFHELSQVVQGRGSLKQLIRNIEINPRNTDDPAM